jgi:thymidylate synthase
MKNTFNNATEAFEYLYDEIMKHGVESEANTKALFNVGFTILNSQDNMITTPWRKFNTDYCVREWNWYLSGDRSVAEIKKYAKIWDRMHGGDNIVNSNYGWQWMRNGQLGKCIEQLRNNHQNRQAVVTIYDGKEKDDYAYDTPCTLDIIFDANDGKLNMSVLMRSNDLVYGFCNDQYCFSQLQKMVAEKLELPIGYYYHYVHNMHIYPRHFDMKTKNAQ